MNNKNNVKAFTIIELLGVIVILGALATIIMPSVSKYINAGKTEYDKSLAEELLLAGKNYYSENRINLPKTPGEISYITAKEMLSLNLISQETINSKNQDCSDSYVIVKKIDNDYKYTSCMVCDGELYNNETQDCET